MQEELRQVKRRSGRGNEAVVWGAPRVRLPLDRLGAFSLSKRLTSAATIERLPPAKMSLDRSRHLAQASVPAPFSSARCKPGPSDPLRMISAGAGAFSRRAFLAG